VSSMEEARQQPGGAVAERSSTPEGRLPVSVIIPAYNRADLVWRALASVNTQRPALPAEVIVVDDGSTDDTAAAAERLGARVIRHGRNRGLSAARNTGVAHATQPWVALLDSDDEWLPHHLATLWSLHDHHVLVAGSALWCGTNPEEDRFHGTVRRRPLVLESPASLVFPDNQVPVSAAMARRDVVREVGGFRAYEGVAEDFDLWIRLLSRGTGILSPVVTLLYHVHAEQMSRDYTVMHRAHIGVSESYAGQRWWSPKLVERWRGRSRWDRLGLAVKAGRYGEAVRHLLAIVSHPQRMLGVAGTWFRRFFIRRRSSAVARDGGPSVAVLPGEPDGNEAMALVDGRPIVDLRNRGPFLRAWLRLVRRPTAFAVTHSRGRSALLRLIGVRAIRADKDGGGPLPP
jgi:glycosyltransferase involved in cell wall biosynthesis